MEADTSATFEADSWPTHGLWAAAREKLTSHPRATVLNKKPTMYMIDDVISEDESRELIDLHLSIAEPREHQNLTWCFRNLRLLQDEIRFGHLKASPEDLFEWEDSFGKHCVHAHAAHHQLSRVHAVSSSVLIPRGENALVDKIERRLHDRPRCRSFGRRRGQRKRRWQGCGDMSHITYHMHNM